MEQGELARQDIQKWFASDEEFNSLYPQPIKHAAQKHWTRINVARKASEFLVSENGVRILDIGSGAGKFCLTSAYYHPQASFTGVEQRESLVELCKVLKEKLGLKNVDFIHSNITDINFLDYDNFYFYNSFYENIEGTEKIDYSVPYSEKLYDYYNLFLYKQLKKLPVATRIVTFHSFGNEMPQSYQVIHTDYDGYLKFWVKIR